MFVEKDTAQQTYWQSAAIYGLIIGGIFSVIALISMWSYNRDVDFSNYAVGISLVFLLKAAVILICQAVIMRRRLPLYADGMRFGEIFSYLTAVMFFSGIVYGSFCAIVESNLMIDYYEAGRMLYIDKVMEYMPMFGEQFPTATTDQMIKAPSMLGNLFNTIANMIIGGALMALFIAAIFRRREPLMGGEE